jgi:hypothetical protein
MEARFLFKGLIGEHQAHDGGDAHDQGQHDDTVEDTKTGLPGAISRSNGSRDETAPGGARFEDSFHGG